MYKIGVWGNTNNYFFKKVVETLSINNTISYDIKREDLDFIFCANDIRPIIQSNVPIITWISERPTWTYLWKQFGVRCADIIFVTEQEFVEQIKKITGNDQVFFLPLATSFKDERNPGYYKYKLSFVGNTMEKQVEAIETECDLFKLPFKNEDYMELKKRWKN